MGATTESPATTTTRRDLLKLATLGAGAASSGLAMAPPAEASAAPGDVPPMRSRPEPRPAEAPLTVPSLAGIVLNRAAFGPWPGDVAAFNALGATDDQRLQAWVDAQLDPAAIPDADCDNRLANSGFTTLNKTLGQLWADHVIGSPPWDVRLRPYRETQRAAFIRAIYSRRQLKEVLADFWHNHFNVYGDEGMQGPVFVHYDRDVIRAHMLGNFRAMLEAVARSTGMMYMLDNYTSSASGPNENFARELFELHTLGAENYLGVMRQADVPVDNQGRPIGYVDADVFEATRCFTGWSVANGQSGAPNTGEFHYRTTWHDRFQKNVLKVFIPQDQPDLVDGRIVLDTLAAHPGTARHVSRKLCRRLIGDAPSQATVDAVAQVFHDQRAAPDQLRQVVRAILLSAEFRATWGTKVKRPFELVASAMRAAAAQFPFVIGNGDSDTFSWLFGKTGQQLFGRRTPDGYPDQRAAWMAPNPRVGCWRLCTWLMNETTNGVHYLDVVGQTPAGVRSANQITDFWIDRVFSRPLAAAQRTAAVSFMAQGMDPTLALPWNDSVKNRVRALVGLLFWSPEFLYR
jgi:uncharacterized protein (DUF1800 family)